MTLSHFHTKGEAQLEGEQYRGLLIPADPGDKIRMVQAKPGWQGLAAAVGAHYIERVYTRIMPELPCSCHCVMIVDEMGLLSNKRKNPRATKWYPFGLGIAGDVMVLGEGRVRDQGSEEMDFISLPLEVNESWEGFPW